MKFLIVCLLVLTSRSFASPSFKLSKDKGMINFLAIGNPSAIRIDGKGEGPEGVLSAEEKGDNLLISGDLKVNLNNLDTGIALRDRHMKEKYLEVSKFENAILKLQVTVPKAALKKDTGTRLPFNGSLDLHGIQKPVSGTFVLKPENDGLKSSASFQIKLSDYSVSVPTFAGISVADVVDVTTNSKVEEVR